MSRLVGDPAENVLDDLDAVGVLEEVVGIRDHVEGDAHLCRTQSGSRGVGTTDFRLCYEGVVDGRLRAGLC